jgi:PhnB protein
MIKFTPYLLFDGNCAEAMAFYKSCLGGELSLTKVGDSPVKDHMPPQLHEKVINSKLTSGAIEISASDWLSAERTPKQGNLVSLYISEGTHDELKELFDKLSEGATLIDPLKELPVGTYGAFTDKYGVPWKFHGDKK